MNRCVGCLLAWVVVLVLAGCAQDWEPDPYDLDFDIPRTEVFADSLSSYALFQEPMASLQPAEGVLLYELSSELFTDYAYKQRLMRLPEGTSATLQEDGTLEYPEGTILAKTFYYPDDMLNPTSLRIIETRLLVKTEGLWNAATYVWNEQQTDATVLLEGMTTKVAWIDSAGQPKETSYAVPHEGECVTCHQSNGVSKFIGPTVANLNRPVERGDRVVPQLKYLQNQGVFTSIDPASAPSLPNFKDATASLEERARAYLDINCAHCHNPGGWDEASEKNLNFKYTTDLGDTRIQSETRAIRRQLQSGEMPYLGTTLQDDDGVRLVLDYIESL